MGLEITLPDSAAAKAKNAFAILGTNEQLHGFIRDLAFVLRGVICALRSSLR
jgi:hypothetical protein